MTSAVPPSSSQLSQGDKYIYYLLMEDHPYGSKLFWAGSMCYLDEKTYLRYISMDMSSIRFWRFIMVEDGSTVTMDVEILHPLDRMAADLLVAISKPRERLNCFLEKLALESALEAREGQRVLMDLDQQTFPGTIRYIGKLRDPFPCGLCPIYFGVELQGDGVGKGHCDGTYNRTEYFQCKPDCGLFLPCNKLRFVAASENVRTKQEEKTEAVEDIPVKVGETVGFYLDDIYTRGVAMAVYKEGSNWMVKVCLEEEGTTDVFRDIPMDSVVKEGLLSSGVSQLEGPIVRLLLDLAGFSPEDVAVQLDGRRLRVTARRETQSQAPDGCCARDTWEVYREVLLPDNVNLEAVACTLNANGQLRIEALRLPLPPDRVVPIHRVEEAIRECLAQKKLKGKK